MTAGRQGRCCIALWHHVLAQGMTLPARIYTEGLQGRPTPPHGGGRWQTQSMRTIASAVTLVLLASACGGGSDTAAPAPATAAPATAAPATAAPTTTVTVPAGFSAICTFNPEELRISCHASGNQPGSQLKWTSDASWAYSAGKQWDFVVDQELLGQQAQIFLEECSGSDCQLVETSVDTSMIDFSNAAPTTTAVDSDPGFDTSSELSVGCTLNVQEHEISCQAFGWQEGSKLAWTSTASHANSMGKQWQFVIADDLIGPVAKIFLEVCSGSDCQLVETSVDTSMFPPYDPTAELGCLARCTVSVLAESLDLILPFETGSGYDATTQSFGSLTFAGRVPIEPFAGGGDDHWTVPGKKAAEIFFNFVPGTIVIAATAGRIETQKQDLYWEDPLGVYTHDWELLLYTDTEAELFIDYDHLVDLQVENGQWVEQGDSLGRGTPARLMFPYEEPFDFFEFGVKGSRYKWPGPRKFEPQTYCPEYFLSPEDRQFLQDVLTQMELEGFPSGPTACLTDEFADDHTEDGRSSWETTSEPEELSAPCSLNRAFREISCNAVGTTEGSQLRWESNVFGEGDEHRYSFRLKDQWQLVPEVVVMLTECQGSVCETVETTLDTSVLVPSSSGGSTE